MFEVERKDGVGQNVFAVSEQGRGGLARGGDDAKGGFAVLVQEGEVNGVCEGGVEVGEWEDKRRGIGRLVLRFQGRLLGSVGIGIIVIFDKITLAKGPNLRAAHLLLGSAVKKLYVSLRSADQGAMPGKSGFS